MASGAEDDDVAKFRKRNFREDFSLHHQRLVDIAIGRYTPDENAIDREILAGDLVMPMNGLDQLKLMIQLEFLASLQKEMQGTEDATATRKGSEPHVYDVWLMEVTIDSMNRRLAICMPTRSNELCWYDGRTDVWPMSPPCHKWRVASLSGPARTLSALDSPGLSNNLMGDAMHREGILQVLQDDDNADSLLRSRLDEHIRRKLNSCQRQTVATLIDPAFERGFLPILGPPGTGKSSALVAMISTFCETGELLVVAPSNAAVANLALRAWMTRLFALEDLLVYGENVDESVRFLNPVIRGEHLSKLFKDYALLSEAVQEQKRLEMLTWLQVKSDLSLADLSQVCPYIDRNTKEGRNLYGTMISNAKVVFCTLNSSGAALVRNNVRARTIMLDEAGQCTEAEFYIAASFYDVKRMVVIGDPKQLPATVIHPACRHAGLGRSWLEKVHRTQRHKVHVLDTQYRMHPQILAFPNATFYDDQINSGENVYGRTPFVENPFLFIDTDGKGHEECEDFSWRNVYEVTCVKSLLFQDPDIVRLLDHDDCCRIIIITPYKSQAALLREHINHLRVAPKCEISTVDAFQGQEGDVVIICTVRTHKVGFIDDAQRVNVAMTRAKRVLRVVGDARLFDSLGESSTLRRLVRFAKDQELLISSKIKSSPWCPPNWNNQCLWTPLMSSHFQNCIRKLSKRDQYICMNTLLALSQGNLLDLDGGTTFQLKRGLPLWCMSYLKGYADKRIVWYAKILETHAIEAVFAGSRNECIQFMIHTRVPPEAIVVRSDLSGSVLGNGDQSDGDQEEIEDADLVVSWRVTNATQACILEGNQLPRGNMQLDKSQEAVCGRQPPLIIESRSGTGKTLVLIQHSAYHFDKEQRGTLSCFVTVSPGLREELKRSYEEINEAENLVLPETHFYTFEELLLLLVRMKKIHEFDYLRRCTFLGFKSAQKSFVKEKVEPELVENEIGGVIVGSLTAALQGRPLTREQYKMDIRSNVGRKSQMDLQLRDCIYDEYESYLTWKRDTGKYDIGDIVSRLLKESWKEVFSSLYLDEVQDFSYAGAFLLFHLGGKSRMRWICAGDPAQMISPGCSFTFDGLKQVMLAVRPGMESRLSEVTHLFVNYRTTKDVLEVANEILRIIRTFFPGSITFARPETARKDLKLKIVLCDRSLALEQSVKLKANQAIVFSSKNLEETERQMIEWVGSHPFILSSADSKGLEFEDVIVVFDHDRKTWQPERRSDATLRMLRELYVATTRAQRQLVILVDKTISTMLEFFQFMNYDFHQDGAEMVLREFDTISSAEDWLQKAEGFVSNLQFRLAARCFNLAGEKAMYHWSSAKFYESQGDDFKAAGNFISALEMFASQQNYERVLEVGLMLSSSQMMEHCSWTKEMHSHVDLAISRRPDHLARADVVKLALASEAWDKVRMEDLFDGELSSLFIVYRKQPALRKLVREASTDERHELLHVMPALVGDYHVDKKDFADAVAAYLRCHSTHDAVSATEAVLKQFNVSQKYGKCEILKILSLWNESPKKPGYPVSLLLKLFRAPVETAQSELKECMTRLGRSVIILAVEEKQKSRVPLYEIAPAEFYTEVTEELLSQCNDHFQVVEWFCKRDNVEMALEFAKQFVKKFSARTLSRVVLLCGVLPFWLSSEAYRKDELGELLLHLFASRASFYQKHSYTRIMASQFEDLNELSLSGNLAVLAWCLGTVSQQGPPRRMKSNRRNTPRAPDAKKVSHQEAIESAQYSCEAIASLWPVSEKDSESSSFSTSESMSLLSFLFEITNPTLQKTICTKMLKLRNPTPSSSTEASDSERY